jgi:exopolysaccharide biosynthesis polyprenyl glycosylphosphotransferase
MKKADIILNVILVPLDFVLLWSAAISAYYLRFSERVVNIRPVFYEMPFYDYVILAFQVSLVGLIIFALAGFYTMGSKKLVKELPRVFTGVSILIVFLVLAIFLKRELFSSRFIIILSWSLGIIYLSIGRIIIFYIRNKFFHWGWGLANIIVLGPHDSRQTVINEYQKNPRLGFRVVNQCRDLNSLKESDKVKEHIEKKKVDYIIQTDSAISKDQALDLLTFCQENHISLKYVASLFQAQSLHLNLSSVAGLPLVEIQSTPLDGWGKVVKRLFDFFIALILLIILSPLFLVLAILIKLTSKGTVFVSLSRVGAKGKMFKLYKFRSMITGAHQMKEKMMAYNERADGPLFKIKDDPRVTKLGRRLRRTSLDELPQLFNVLKGQMSLVGPRPHEPEEVLKYQRGYKKLLTIKPGMTGMAQVSGRSNLPFTEEAKLDIFYIENWSMLLDLVILLKTPFIVLKKDAY